MCRLGIDVRAGDVRTLPRRAERHRVADAAGANDDHGLAVQSKQIRSSASDMPERSPVGTLKIHDEAVGDRREDNPGERGIEPAWTRRDDERHREQRRDARGDRGQRCRRAGAWHVETAEDRDKERDAEHGVEDGQRLRDGSEKIDRATPEAPAATATTRATNRRCWSDASGLKCLL